MTLAARPLWPAVFAMSTLAATTVASTAGAQPSADSQSGASANAVAEALFKEGKSLRDAKRYDEACPKLAESLRLVPGTGTLLALSLCHEEQGKLASAWVEFRAALAASEKAGRSDRTGLAREHIASIEPRLSTLKIQPAARVPGMQLKVNNEAMDDAALGTAVPMDGGDYELRLSAPGYEPTVTKVHLEPAGDAKSVDLPALTPSAPAASAPETIAPAPGSSPSRSAMTPSARTTAIAGAGVAVVGAAVVAVAGAMTISKSNQARGLCGDGGQCSDSVALSAASDARTFATVANVGAGATVVGAAAFVIGMWILPRSSTPEAPAVAFDGRQETLTWRW